MSTQIATISEDVMKYCNQTSFPSNDIEKNTIFTQVTSANATKALVP
jgi:hypothetical protein